MPTFTSKFSLALLIVAAPVAGCHPHPPALADASTAAVRDTLIALDSAMNQAVDNLDCVRGLSYVGDQQPLFVSGGHVVQTHADLLALCGQIVAPRSGARFAPQTIAAHLLSPDAGYVVKQGEYTIRLRDGQVRSEHLAMTTIWIRQAGRWVMVHLHESAFPSPAPSATAPSAGTGRPLPH